MDIPTDEPEQTRVCSMCGINKPASAFRLRKKGEKRRSSYCIQCANACSARWRSANPGRVESREGEFENRTSSRRKHARDADMGKHFLYGRGLRPR